MDYVADNYHSGPIGIIGRTLVEEFCRCLQRIEHDCFSSKDVETYNVAIVLLGPF